MVVVLYLWTLGGGVKKIATDTFKGLVGGSGFGNDNTIAVLPNFKSVLFKYEGSKNETILVGAIAFVNGMVEKTFVMGEGYLFEQQLRISKSGDKLSISNQGSYQKSNFTWDPRNYPVNGAYLQAEDNVNYDCVVIYKPEGTSYNDWSFRYDSSTNTILIYDK